MEHIIKGYAMKYKDIKKKLNKVFEMVSSAAGIVGIENLHDKKKVIKKNKEPLEGKQNGK